METVFDFVSLGLFAGLAVLYLQRSVEPEARDRVIDYVPPALGCALANYVGNHGHPVIAVLIVLVVIANIWIVLKPFART